MPKTDDGSTGIKSISKSQKTKGARDAKRAKLGLVKKHGGTCSSCGQCSTSCTPGTPHLGCKGYFQGDLGSPALNRLAEQSQSAMLFDGSPIERPVEGYWLTDDKLAAVMQRRSERTTEAEIILRRQVHLITLREGDKVTGVKVENGMGDRLVWFEGKWTVDVQHTLAEPEAVVSLDPNPIADDIHLGESEAA